MELKYQLTERDYSQTIPYTLKYVPHVKKQLHKQLIIEMILVAFLYCVFIALSNPIKSSAGDILYPLILLVVEISIAFSSPRLSVKQSQVLLKNKVKRQDKNLLLGEMAVSLEADGIHMSNLNRKSIYAYPSVEYILIGDSFLYIYCGGILLVPFRAFESLIDVPIFISELKNKVNNSDLLIINKSDAISIT